MSGRPASDMEMTHVCYAVSNIPEAARRYAAILGAGPFFVLPPSEYEEISHDGGPATFEHGLAFGQWGPIAIELQEVTAAEPAAVADALQAPAGTLTHISYMTPNLADESERLAKLGIEPLLVARSGPVELAFHRGPEMGHAIELHQRCEFLEEFFAMVREASEGWDGQDVVREA